MAKYKLPPLVLFESHADRSTVDFLLENLDYLKKAGYKTICFEIEVGQTLEQQIELLGRLIPMQSEEVTKMNPSHPEFQRELELLLSIGSKQQLFLKMKEMGMEFKAIDTSPQEQLKTGLNSIERNEILAKGTIATAAETDGGVIAVIGFGHCIYQQAIGKFDNEHAEQYLWYHMHNPAKETLAHQEIVGAYQEKGYRTYFPLGVTVTDVTKDKKLNKSVREAISEKCYNYEAQDLDTSTAKILKQIINPGVSAHLRTGGEHHVDAIIPIPKKGPSRNDFLYNLDKALLGISYEVQGTRAIIRDINSEPVAKKISSLNLH